MTRIETSRLDLHSRKSYRKPRMTVIMLHHQESLMTGSTPESSNIKVLKGSAPTSDPNYKWLELE